MPESATKAAIKLVSRALAPRLKAHGFRRQADHFHRQGHDVFHGINFQGSQWGGASQGRFTVNLVVTADWFYAAWTDAAFPANPASALFPLICRIGKTTPIGRDCWWDVDANTDPLGLTADVERHLVDFALPFFDSFGSVESLLERLRADDPIPGVHPWPFIVHAIIAAHLGLQDEARSVLTKAARFSTDAEDSKAHRLARRLGIALS